jgi:hypothetical protein
MEDMRCRSVNVLGAVNQLNSTGLFESWDIK